MACFSGGHFSALIHRFSSVGYHMGVVGDVVEEIVSIDGGQKRR